jgi:AcrR family transcriptional regulator
VSSGTDGGSAARSRAGSRAEAPEVPVQIVEAARHVLAEDGLAAATLERISTAAGISRMTLHRRGLSKRDILRAIADQLEHDYREAVWPALVSKGTGRERLQRALELLCEVSEENRELMEALSAPARDAIYHERRAVGSRERAPGVLTRKVFVEPLERLLIDGAEDGSLSASDPAERATLIFNAVCHTYGHLRAGHGWTSKRARDSVIGLVMEGVVSRADAPRPARASAPARRSA